MIGFYDYTVVVTYISFISAICGMFCAIEGNLPFAVFCLAFSGFCDMFDGKVARTKKGRSKSEKQFGIQIDSLCDAVCFGVLPSVIGYSIGMNSWYDVPVLVIFPLCAIIRLAYFNVAEEERQQKTSEIRKTYEGLPVTSVALIIPLLYSFHKDIGTKWFPTVYGFSLLIIAIAFITRFKVKKPSIKIMIAFIGIGFAELTWMLYKTKIR